MPTTRPPWTPLLATVVAGAWLGAALIGAGLAYLADRLIHGATARLVPVPVEGSAWPRSIWETSDVDVTPAGLVQRSVFTPVRDTTLN